MFQCGKIPVMRVTFSWYQKLFPKLSSKGAISTFELSYNLAKFQIFEKQRTEMGEILVF